MSEELKAKHPAVDWRNIAGFRNVLVHDYLGVNLVRVWEVIEQYLPAFKQEIEATLQELDPPA